jgi:hypothetical protein
MMDLEIGINNHYSLCDSHYPQLIDSKECQTCLLIEIVYKMGFKYGWQTAHQEWENYERS